LHLTSRQFQRLKQRFQATRRPLLRNPLRRLLSRTSGSVICCDDDVDVEPYGLGRKGGELLGPPTSPSPLDDDVLTLDIAELLEPLAKGCGRWRVRGRRCGEKGDSSEHVIAVVRRANLIPLLIPAVASSAWALAQLGEASEALNRLREGEQLLERHSASGFVGLRVWICHSLGRACLLVGRLDDARRLSDGGCLALLFSAAQRKPYRRIFLLRGNRSRHNRLVPQEIWVSAPRWWGGPHPMDDVRSRSTRVSSD
jgi:hypothetical protein